MTSLTFWFFFSLSELSAVTTEIVENKQENRSIKYVKQIESICLWALGEPKEKKKFQIRIFDGVHCLGLQISVKLLNMI